MKYYIQDSKYGLSNPASVKPTVTLHSTMKAQQSNHVVVYILHIAIIVHFILTKTAWNHTFVFRFLS